MSENNNNRSLEVRHLFEGLVHRIEAEASEGRSKTTLDVALEIKADALKQLEGDIEKHTQFLETCDTVIEFIKLNPDKAISDFLKDRGIKSP